MRIGFDITALRIAVGGIFWYDLNLLSAAVAAGPQHEFILLDYLPIRGRPTAPPDVVELESENVRVVRCPGPTHRRLSRWEPLQRTALAGAAEFVDRTVLWPWAAASRAAMRRKVPGVLAGVDVFHSSDVLQFRQPGALNVVTVYDVTVALYPGLQSRGTRELQWGKYRFAREEADAIVTISEATKRDIAAHLMIPASRIHVVYPGVSPQFRPIDDGAALAEALAAFGLAPGGYILHVGTLEARKNLGRLIEAYGRMRTVMARPAPKLVLVGAEGWGSADVLRRPEGEAWAHDVRFLGHVPRSSLPALYNGAAIFVYPSLYEGFGLPPLEAMACGAPVVASNASAIREVVGRAGVLVDPTDTAGLAEAMAGLLDDCERRSSLRTAGLARAKAFTWERAARRLLEVYGAAGG